MFRVSKVHDQENAHSYSAVHQNPAIKRQETFQNVSLCRFQLQIGWPALQMGARLLAYLVSGLKASATPATTRLPQKMYMGHSHPSGSAFSPGLMPQSQPLGGSNCDSPPPPPCRRAVTEKDRIAGCRAQRTARSGAIVWRMMAILCLSFSASLRLRDVDADSMALGLRGYREYAGPLLEEDSGMAIT